jgi:hypothetical protein
MVEGFLVVGEGISDLRVLVPRSVGLLVVDYFFSVSLTFLLPEEMLLILVSFPTAIVR